LPEPSPSPPPYLPDAHVPATVDLLKRIDLKNDWTYGKAAFDNETGRRGQVLKVSVWRAVS
jgi:hypothetical protein